MTKRTPVATSLPATVAKTPTEPRRVGWFMRRLPIVTLLSVITITASSEFEFAENVLRLPPYVAWALPVAVDTYVLAAFRTGRDISGAMGVMAATLAAAVGSHLVTADGGKLPPVVQGFAATLTMIVLVVVAWRVHVLIETFAVEGRRAKPTHPVAEIAVVAATTPDATQPDEITTTPVPVATNPPKPRRDEPPATDATTQAETRRQTEWIVARLADEARRTTGEAPTPAAIRAWGRDLEHPIDITDPRSRRIRDEITKRLAAPGEQATTAQEA